MSGFGDFGSGMMGGGEEGIDLDFTQAEKVPEFQLLPKGTYVLMSLDAEGTPTKDGSGRIIRIQWQVWEGPYEGRLIRDGLWIPDRNTQTPEKYKTSMDFFCAKLEAITGEPWLHQQKKLYPSMLKGKLVTAKIEIKKGESGEFNNITRYYKYELGSTPGSAPSSPAVNAPTIPSGGQAVPSPFNV